MARSTTKITKSCNLIAALAVWAAIPYSGQTFPQFLAQIASLDSDHAVSLHVTSNGVYLILAHDPHGSATTEDAQSLAPAPLEPPHVFHVITEPATAKLSTSTIVSKARDVVTFFSTPGAVECSPFVPRLPLAYSRPPPERMVNPFDRSTLLLI